MRGISNIIAAIILVMISIAVGAMLYLWMSGKFGAMTGTSKTITATVMATADVTGSNNTIVINLKNPNTIGIKDVTITLLKGGAVIATAKWSYSGASQIQSGQSRSFTIELSKTATGVTITATDGLGNAASSASASGTYAPGDKVTAMISVTFTDGSTLSTTVTGVVVQS